MTATHTAQDSPRGEFWAGVRAQLPILFGTTPFGLIFGVVASQAELPFTIIAAMSAIVFAGSAQFIAAELFLLGTSGPVIVLTTWVVNIRHALYSATLAPYTAHLSKLWKYLLSFLLTDEAFATTVIRYRKEPVEATRDNHAHWFFLGSGLALWVSWQIATWIGAFVGTQVPDSWSLDFALPLTFIALVVPTLIDRPSWVAALVAGITAILARGLPYNLGLMVAVLVGITAAMITERFYPPALDQVPEVSDA